MKHVLGIIPIQHFLICSYGSLIPCFTLSDLPFKAVCLCWVLCLLHTCCRCSSCLLSHAVASRTADGEERQSSNRVLFSSSSWVWDWRLSSLTCFHPVISYIQWEEERGQGQDRGLRLRDTHYYVRMGSTCIPVADSFWCLAKLIQCLRF